MNEIHPLFSTVAAFACCGSCQALNVSNPRKLLGFLHYFLEKVVLVFFFTFKGSVIYFLYSGLKEAL